MTKLPWLYAVNDRPVKMVKAPDGGMDVLVFDWKTGDFVRDMSYLSRCFEPGKDIDQFDEARFNDRIDGLRRGIAGRRLYVPEIGGTRVLEIDPNCGQLRLLDGTPPAPPADGAFAETANGMIARFERDGVMHLLVGGRVVRLNDPRLSIRLEPAEGGMRIQLKLGETSVADGTWSDSEGGLLLRQMAPRIDEWRAAEHG